MTAAPKGIRYLLIVVLYNFILACIAFGTQWASRLWFNFNYEEWTIPDWWMFFSIFILIGAMMLYLTPYLEKRLAQTLENSLKKLRMKPNLSLKEKEKQIETKYPKEKEIEEFKEDDLQKSFP